MPGLRPCCLTEKEKILFQSVEGNMYRKVKGLTGEDGRVTVKIRDVSRNRTEGHPEGKN